MKEGLYSLELNVNMLKRSDLAPIGTACNNLILGGHIKDQTDICTPWNKKFGYFSPERLFEGSKVFSFVPNITVYTANSVLCTECFIQKTKRVPIKQSNRLYIRRFELIKMDVLGQMWTNSLEYRYYALGIIDGYTDYPEDYILSDRGKLYEAV